MEGYEHISLLKDEIKECFEENGFQCVDSSGLSWFEECDRKSAYVHPSFFGESMPIPDYIQAIKKADAALGELDIPVATKIVCHLPGSMAFLVYLEP